MYGASIGALLAGTAIAVKHYRQKDDFFNYAVGGAAVGSYVSMGKKSFSRGVSTAVVYSLLFGFFGHLSMSLENFWRGDEGIVDRREKSAVVGTNVISEVVDGALRNIEQEE